jgi:hypothetical protein
LRYTRHSLIPEPGGAPGGGPAGALSLSLRPDRDALILRATETVQAGFTVLTAEAEIACAPDPLLTPQRWSLSLCWQTGPQSGAAKGEMDQKRSGRSSGKELIFNAAKERRRPAPERWTGFWNLFSAVQRLPFQAASVLTFDLFEEMDLFKPGQRLVYIGPQTVTLKGQPIALHVFEQTGHGVLPWHWWLDEQHRVVLASGGQRAYLLDSEAKGGAA